MDPIKIPLWRRWLSYLFRQQIEVITGITNRPVYLDLEQGRFQLSTDRAVYSFEDRYDNFRLTFKAIQTERLQGKKILILGGGLGSIVLILEKINKIKARFTLVELDAGILRLFMSYVKPDLTNEIEIFNTDAHLFMDQNNYKYDMIIIDVFYDEFIPAEFKTPEFIGSCQKSLEDGGLVCFNWMTSTPALRAECDRYVNNVFKKTFPSPAVLHLKYNHMLISDSNWVNG